MPRNPKKPIRQSKMSAALRKILERLLMIVLVIVCIAAFYLAVILAEIPADQQAPKETKAPSVALSPEQARQTSSFAEISRLTEIFPAPVLALQETDELLFDGGVVNDLAYEGAFARLATLNYHTQAGEKLTLVSIYPSEAFSLLPKGDYLINNTLTGALAGMTAVRMESEEGIRLHVRGENALYAFMATKMEEEQLTKLSRQAMLIMP